MSRFATLDTLRKKDSEGGEGRQSFYAGGAGNQGGSGVNVYGAGDGKSADTIDKILANAKPPTASGGGGDESKDDGPSTTITFWSNGFQVDDGPFRDSTDPDNAPFLADIEKGYVPRELREAGRGRKIVVKNKRTEAYKPPTPPPYTAFSGAGNSMADAGEDVSKAALGIAGAGGGSSGAGAAPEFSVDPSQPTTNVRVTMPNGKRQVFKFNTSHTVGDLLSQVAASPDVAGAFALMAGFPPKPLQDSGATLEAAGLLNSNVRVNGL